MLPVDLVSNYSVLEPLPALAPGEQRFLLEPLKNPAGPDGPFYAGVYFGGPLENGRDRKAEWSRLADSMSHTHSEHLPQVLECQARGPGYMIVGKVISRNTLRTLLGPGRTLSMLALEGVFHAIICGIEDAIDAGWPEVPLSSRAILARRSAEGNLVIQLPIPPLCPALDDYDSSCQPPIIPETTEHYLRQLARLLYSLLGYRAPMTTSAEGIPAMPRPKALSDQQFALLQALLLPDAPGLEEDLPITAPDFFSQFFGKPWSRQEIEQWELPTREAAERFDINISPLYSGQFAWTEHLRLVPEQPGYPALQLVASPEFFIGRSPVEADFVTQFFPRTQENDRDTLKISRRHLCLRLVGEEYLLENLSDPGLPPPRLNDAAVEVDAALPPDSVITLPGPYQLRVLFLPSNFSAPRTCSDYDLEESSILDGGFAITSLSKGALPFSGLWITSDAAIYVQDDALFFEPPDPHVHSQPALRIHHFAGGFWVERLLDPILVTLDDWEIDPGHAAPLLKNSTLTIGQTLRYTIQALET